MDYQTLKLLHILGACLFIGNNLVTPFWRAFAERTRHPAIVAWSQKLITRTDVVFTGGGITLLLATGHAMAAQLPGLWQENWFLWAYILFALSGVIWLVALLPLQMKQARLAKAFHDEATIPDEFWRLARRWSIAGAAASILPLASLALMVLK
ncbi:DUF2269 domain-containing protein [Pelagicoccus sp. SDUM812003]|uniref:DUF2269 family protein n=1 Tax=Pelagicoccus sp. SDUM812003 TaxID=3041267 RepID=UPI00281078FE|nr:DUF2269 domain-containing protein [Pelagicoccus sp. SDUM812003]MDQ8201777.1 DUF2269 domain-containing protein [Pelagicoccus sp. SDUM812003]